MWEVIDSLEFSDGRTATVDLWRGRDAEGRDIYATTGRHNGHLVEPSGHEIFYSAAVAKQLVGWM